MDGKAIRTQEKKETLKIERETHKGVLIIFVPWPGLFILLLRFKADIRVMVWKGYSTFPRSPELEPHHQMLFSVIHWTLLYCLMPLQGIQQNPQDSNFLSLLINTRFCHLVGIEWFVCVSKSQRILCVLFSRTDSSLCIYHLVVW